MKKKVAPENPRKVVVVTIIADTDSETPFDIARTMINFCEGLYEITALEIQDRWV